MKKMMILGLGLILFGVGLDAVAQNTLSKEERDKAIASLKATQDELLKTVKGLTADQLNYKPDADTWSVAECLEHIAISENGLSMLVQSTLKEEADPSQRADLVMSDDEVYSMISDRTEKIKTRPDLEPKNNFGSFDGSLEAFKTKRKENMKYLKKTEDDLRNHFYDFPFGKVDAYQIVIFMSGHCNRHTKQIQELIDSQGFPSA